MPVSTVRAAAIAYNESHRDWTTALTEQVITGDVVLLVGGDIAHGGKTLLWATPAVRLAVGNEFDEFAHVGEPVEALVTLKRGQIVPKMIEWWAKKNFGTELPRELIR
jgi:hypothetical protein